MGMTLLDSSENDFTGSIAVLITVRNESQATSRYSQRPEMISTNKVYEGLTATIACIRVGVCVCGYVCMCVAVENRPPKEQ